jgi:hypothetical protein
MKPVSLARFSNAEFGGSSTGRVGRDNGFSFCVVLSSETVKSCAMIITDANEFVAEVHDRMPVAAHVVRMALRQSAIFFSVPEWNAPALFFS